MKYQFTLLIFAIMEVAPLISQNTVQEIPDENSVNFRAITTGMPFAIIAPDARSSGMGDMGVATSVDGYSQQYNLAKYAFSEAKSGISMNYTPYLQRLVNDINLGYVTYFNRLNEFSAFSASLKYFSIGTIFITNDGVTGFDERPNEFAFDLGYSLRLGERFAMGIALRYLRSDLRIQTGNVDITAANTFGGDITGYYQSEEIAYNDFNGRWRGGFAIQNLGPRFSYDDGASETFQPTTLRLGGGFDFIFDDYNKLGVTTEFTKLLVPTPPIIGDRIVFTDANGDGVFNVDDGDTQTQEQSDASRSGVILSGQDNDVGFMQGMFQSFTDAPGGFSEELQEFTWALGLEYLYNNAFALRAGYFNEAEEKGARQFFTIGAGFKYTTINIDLSYLFSASNIQSPLENTLRFSLTFNFGDGEYEEY